MIFNPKNEVQKKLVGQYWTLFFMLLFVGAVSYLISFFLNSLDYTGNYARPSMSPAFIALSWLSIIGLILVTGPFAAGKSYAFLRMSRLERVEFGDIFEGFRSHFGKSIGLSLLMGLKLFLWTLLLIIPGIIKNFAYSMSYYILVDEPDTKVNDAIKRSNEMMKGNKGKLFGYLLSLIPYYLPAIACGMISVYFSTRGMAGGYWISYALSILLSLAVQPLAEGITSDFYYMLKGEYITADGPGAPYMPVIE